MIAVRTLADRVVLHLHAQRIRVAVSACLVIEALFAQFFRCKSVVRVSLSCSILGGILRILTLGASLGEANRHRIVALARALAGGRLADDVMQPGRARVLARRSDVHAFGCGMVFAWDRDKYANCRAVES